MVYGYRTLPRGVNVSCERGELEAVMSAELSTGCNARGSDCSSCTKAPVLLISLYISVSKVEFPIFNCHVQLAG